MQLSFQPLSGNRYKVLGAPKPMVVKKAQIERTRRVLSGAGSKKRGKPVTPLKPPLVVSADWITSRLGLVGCPEASCTWYGRVRHGEKQCPNCGAKFFVR